MNLPGRSLGLWGACTAGLNPFPPPVWGKSTWGGSDFSNMLQSQKLSLPLGYMCHLGLELDLVMSDRKTQFIGF